MLVAGLVLTGCDSSPVASGDPGGSPSTAPQTQPSTPTPTPTPADSISLEVDGLVTMYDGHAVTFSYTDPEPLLTFIEELTGVPRHGEDYDDPWGNGTVFGTSYTWDEIRVSAWTDGQTWVTITADAIGDVPVTTVPGITIGSTRDAVIAAGGWEGWDRDGDGAPDYYGIDPQPVPGTESLSRPDEVGRQYVDVEISGDVVTAVSAPANDFSDI